MRDGKKGRRYLGAYNFIFNEAIIMTHIIDLDKCILQPQWISSKDLLGGRPAEISHFFKTQILA